jgi:signal transduction histidine kinase/CheY-like chemotaxis protein/AraC-like DNA-binding protein
MYDAYSIDSLFTLFNATNGTPHIIIANAIFRHFDKEQFTDSLLTFCIKKRPKDVDARTIYWMSEYEYARSNFDNADSLGTKALPLCEKTGDRVLISDCLSLLSLSCQRKGEFAKALDYQHKCYDIDMENGDKERISSSLNNLAGLYMSTDQPEVGKEYILKAIAIERGLHRNKSLAIRLGMASDIFLKLGDTQQALRYVQEAYHLDYVDGRKDKVAVRLSQMAAVYMAQGYYEKAKSVLLKAIPVLRNQKLDNSLSICLNQMGDVMMKEGNKAAASSYYYKALDISQKTGNRFIENKVQLGLYYALKDVNPKEAMEHLERHVELADSMFKEESARQLNNFRVKYHTHELDDENKAHIEDNKITILVSATVCFLLIVVLCHFAYFLRKKSRSQHEMRQMEKIRTDFFTNITHEFRTPLTVILGFAQQLEKGVIPEGETSESMGTMIRRQGVSLLELINQLLDIAKIKSSVGRAEWQTGDIVAFLNMMTANFRQIATSRKIELTFHSDERSLQMDFVPDYMKKIMRNLLTNSFKFTPREGKINVALKHFEETVIIAVSDTGCGINEEDLPNIFDAFYQTKNKNVEMGTGVGLSLVKQIVDSMDGDINIDSTLGQGTTFTISLPLHHGKKKLAPYVPHKITPAIVDTTPVPMPTNTYDTENNKPLILIVEDNNDVAKYIGSQLTQRYNLVYANNGEDGIKKAMLLVPDVIITDLMMPVMDGLRMCKMVRSQEVINHVPIIVITAKTTEKDRVELLEAGADAYLYKPFNSDELHVRVEKLLEQRAMLREKYKKAESEGNVDDIKMSDSDTNFLQKLVDIVNARLITGKVSAEVVASDLCITSSQLRRKLFALTGENTASYIMRIRINKAKQMIDSDKDMPMADVALACGFDDAAHFTRAFKASCDVTPTQYRKREKGKQASVVN